MLPVFAVSEAPVLPTNPASKPPSPKMEILPVGAETAENTSTPRPPVLVMPRKTTPLPPVRALLTVMPFDVVANVERLAKVIWPLVGAPPTPAVPPQVLSRVMTPGTEIVPGLRLEPDVYTL